MIFLIRGHLRTSLNTRKLYEFINEIVKTDKDLKIYIHTWNIYANNVSWRTIRENNSLVSEETIYKYFGELKKYIKHIIIDDDKKIELFGNIEGNISNGPAPLIGWKNYWYGKYTIIDYINNNIENKNETIVNFRFDLFGNSNSRHLNKENVIAFINKNKNKNYEKNIFFEDKEACGIDNIYIGDIKTMHSLTKKFHYELDEIFKTYNKDNKKINQEKLVFRLNEDLFSKMS